MPRRESSRVREALSPHLGALISTAGKVSEAPPLSVSRAINQEPKTSWVVASPVHPRHRARTRRAPVFPRAPVLPFHLPPIRRINALWLPFTKDASRIPCRIPSWCAPLVPIFRDVRVIAEWVEIRKKKDKKLSASPILCHTSNTKLASVACKSQEITIRLNTIRLNNTLRSLHPR